MKSAIHTSFLVLLALLWQALPCQADSVIAVSQRGDRDPVLSGWNSILNEGFPSVVPGTSAACWAMTNTTYYNYALSEEQATQALKYGWRLSTQVAVEGDILDNTDLMQISLGLGQGDIYYQMSMGPIQNFAFTNIGVKMVSNNPGNDTVFGRVNEGVNLFTNTLELVQSQNGTVAFFLNGVFRTYYY